MRCLFRGHYFALAATSRSNFAQVQQKFLDAEDIGPTSGMTFRRHGFQVNFTGSQNPGDSRNQRYDHFR
jgi:hypothetical protein